MQHGSFNGAFASKDRFQWDSAFDLNMSHSRPDVTWIMSYSRYYIYYNPEIELMHTLLQLFNSTYTYE